MRSRLCSILAVLSAVVLSIDVSAARCRAGSGDGQLDVYWIDVEGGAATLMVMPSGESLLVDSGNPGRRDAQRIFDVAAKVAGLKRIDHLVTTHYHRDHFGGAATLSGFIPIGSVYDNGEFAGGVERPDKEYLEFPAERRVVLNPGDELPLAPANGVDRLQPRVRCLAARGQFVASETGTEPNDAVCAEFRPKDRDGSDNANSIVLLVSFGDFRLFDAGDLTWNMEQKLVCPSNLIGEVDVYQVTHHGLDASNNPLVARSLKPTVAVMNNGVTKGCEPETVATLRETPSIQAIYQVHRNLVPGSKTNTADEFIANEAETCDGNYIQLSVHPDGGSYTLSIPATSHKRTYETKRAR